MSALRTMLGLLLYLPQAKADAVSLETEAEAWLRDQFEYISCDQGGFVYGVGYIDGSYMERVFHATEDGIPPALEVRFRDQTLKQAAGREQAAAVPFVIELRISGARHAILDGGAWRAREGFESALRFKYTNWFGELSWQDGGWQVQWQGYRRPMLPQSLKNEPTRACALFEP